MLDGLGGGRLRLPRDARTARAGRRAPLQALVDTGHSDMRAIAAKVQLAAVEGQAVLPAIRLERPIPCASGILLLVEVPNPLLHPPPACALAIVRYSSASPPHDI